MGTRAETIGIAARPGFTPWTAAVSVLAAAALIMSAVALTVAARDHAVTGVAGAGIEEAASIGTRWDAAKLEAMHGRVLAERARIEAVAPLWDEDKLAAMQGRVLAERARIEGPAVLWDAPKLEAMRGRVLAG